MPCPQTHDRRFVNTGNTYSTAHAEQVFSYGIGNLTFAAAFFACGAERGSNLATEGFF
jgi:hypothetical protein